MECRWYGSGFKLTAGLYLTLVVLRFNPWPRGDEARPSAHRSSIEHLSVHTGDVVKAVPLPRRLVDNITPADWGLNRASERYQWWPVVWESTKEEWETSVVSWRNYSANFPAWFIAYDYRFVTKSNTSRAPKTGHVSGCCPH